MDSMAQSATVAGTMLMPWSCAGSWDTTMEMVLMYNAISTTCSLFHYHFVSLL